MTSVGAGVTAGDNQTIDPDSAGAGAPPRSPAEPDGAPRVPVIDILRGLAILGILFMNINDMGQSLTASFDDIRHLGWTRADQIAWWLREIFANGTTRCLLEMLFGVGMVILTDRFASAAGELAVLRRYYVRNIVLFVFGVIHMYILLWPGDILHSYAMASLVAVLFRSLRARVLIPLGLVFATLQLVGGGLHVVQSRAELAKLPAIEARQAAGQPLTATETQIVKRTAAAAASAARRADQRTRDIAAEDAGRLGTTATWIAAQTQVSLTRFPTWRELGTVWEAAATMLIGAALFKLGIMQGARSRRFYWGMMLLAYAIAIPLRTLGAWDQTRFDGLPQINWATGEYARLAMTLGHIGAVHLLITTSFGRWLLNPFAAAGRTALTLYIAQTLICLWVFYPPFGFHLYGQQGWMALMLTALAVNAALLWWANRWLRSFKIAPVEWAWRSLIEWRRLPFRKPVQVAGMGARTLSA
jgi:uncharacterized protein